MTAREMSQSLSTLNVPVSSHDEVSHTATKPSLKINRSHNLDFYVDPRVQPIDIMVIKCKDYLTLFLLISNTHNTPDKTFVSNTI